jgi:hypothetical protein
MKRARDLFCLVMAATVAAGCSVYKPKATVPRTYDKQMLEDVSKSDLLPTYNALPEATEDDKKRKISRRNQILMELIFLVDHNYSAFEDRFYTSQATFSTAGDFVSLSLTAATAVTGTAHLKSVLAAVATGTTGMKTSVEKNFFDTQTRGAIVAKMRSSRAAELAIIQDEHHMKGGLTDYSLETGLGDVQTYYEAGTLVGALQSISESAGTDQSNAKAKQEANSNKPQAIN